MAKNQKNVIRLGGTVSCGRLYLQDLEFTMSNGTEVIVQKRCIENIDMADFVARHKGRYYLVGLFCRPGFKVLDFPCGSGYAADILKELGVIYEGRELDSPTVEYATRVYGGPTTKFIYDDLCNPQLTVEEYDVIACIEGLEHIDKKCQNPLIGKFKDALKVGGTLIVSSPENQTGISGPSSTNKWHIWELTRADFLLLLHSHFSRQDVELITHKTILHTGEQATEQTTCFYGICHKN